MEFTGSMIINSVLLGLGLAMDAFSVSVINGMNEPGMSKRRMLGIAAVFALFQILMPLIGWFLVEKALEVFDALKGVVPWVAAGLLIYIGGKMLLDGIRKKEEEVQTAVSFGGLMLQGIATSIDALSAGLTMAGEQWSQALTEAGIIGGITFIVCVAGVWIGRKAGKVFNHKASILGGTVLIAIAVKTIVTTLIGG